MPMCFDAIDPEPARAPRHHPRPADSLVPDEPCRARHRRAVVPADPWRRAPPRLAGGGQARHPELPQPDRAGGRRARLFRHAAADGQVVRGFLGGGVGHDPADAAGAVPGGGAAGAVGAVHDRAHGGHLRPAVGRAAAGQRGHRRRSGRARRRRRVPRPHRALRGDRRVPARVAPHDGGRDGGLRRHASQQQGRPPAVSAGAAALSAAVFRRLLGGRPAGRGRARRRVPHLGRAAGGGGGEDRGGAGAGGGARPHPVVRHPAARDRPRNLRTRPGPPPTR